MNISVKVYKKFHNVWLNRVLDTFAFLIWLWKAVNVEYTTQPIDETEIHIVVEE